ncbi:DUF4817 domain-containing protein, partial [Burkholderia contaminans]|nr:DUF4817 domain-containing protein [Burkholderia contaminans]
MLSLQEKIEIVLISGENTPYRQVADIFNGRHPGKNIQHSTVLRIMKKSKQSGSVENQFKKQHNPSKYDEEVQLNVCLRVVEHGQISINNISETTGYKRESIRKILKKNKFLAYKPRF